jgi:tRNA (guanine-N7-)-methyltransferase
MDSFPHTIQPKFDEVFNKDYPLKNKWKTDFFKNTNPIIVELGCGRGEYTVGLAKSFPEYNFFGVDIKGARIWQGAKESFVAGLKNVGFIRTRIEFISSFFAHDEVEQIWLTFPDPQLKRRRNKKRLTAPRFLSLYQQLLVNNGIIHLKTDNYVLYKYTLDLALHNELKVVVATDDLYNSGLCNDILSIKTFYESEYLAKGMPIHYLKFELPKDKEIIDLPEDEDEDNEQDE